MFNANTLQKSFFFYAISNNSLFLLKKFIFLWPLKSRSQYTDHEVNLPPVPLFLDCLHLLGQLGFRTCCTQLFQPLGEMWSY